MLNLLEPLDLHRKDFLGPDHVHLLVQAKQIAYHDRDHVLADPAFADVPVERLISKQYARRARPADRSKRRALKWDKVPSFGSLAGDTVYVAAVDRDGNAASLIQSLYGVFGSCVVAGSTGVVLQNRGAYFSLDPQPSQPARARQDPAAHADRLDGLARRQALERARLHGRRRPAADPAAGLLGDDRLRPRHPGGARDAALPVRPLRARRGARHAAHRGRFPAATIDELEQRGHPSIAGATGTRWPATPTASPSIGGTAR